MARNQRPSPGNGASPSAGMLERTRDEFVAAAKRWPAFFFQVTADVPVEIQAEIAALNGQEKMAAARRHVDQLAGDRILAGPWALIGRNDQPRIGFWDDHAPTRHSAPFGDRIHCTEFEPFSFGEIGGDGRYVLGWPTAKNDGTRQLRAARDHFRELSRHALAASPQIACERGEPPDLSWLRHVLTKLTPVLLESLLIPFANCIGAAIAFTPPENIFLHSAAAIDEQIHTRLDSATKKFIEEAAAATAAAVSRTAVPARHTAGVKRDPRVAELVKRAHEIAELDDGRPGPKRIFKLLKDELPPSKRLPPGFTQTTLAYAMRYDRRTRSKSGR